MALVPRMFCNWWDDIDRYHRKMEERFQKLNVRDDDLCGLPSTPFRDRFRPWGTVFDNLEHEIGGWATVDRDEKYQMIVDVKQFKPEEITVRTDNKYIIVEAKHPERRDEQGFVSRQLMRRYLLPKGYDIGHVRPKLWSDGILSITVPRLALPAPGEQIVPIRRAFPAIKVT